MKQGILIRHRHLHHSLLHTGSLLDVAYLMNFEDDTISKVMRFMKRNVFVQYLVISKSNLAGCFRALVFKYMSEEKREGCVAYIHNLIAVSIIKGSR